MGERIPEIRQRFEISSKACVNDAPPLERSEDIAIAGGLGFSQLPQQTVAQVKAALDRELKPALNGCVDRVKWGDRGRIGGLVLLEVLQIDVEQPQQFALTLG
jgi:hypothetical protein